MVSDDPPTVTMVVEAPAGWRIGSIAWAGPADARAIIKAKRVKGAVRTFIVENLQRYKGSAA